MVNKIWRVCAAAAKSLQLCLTLWDPMDCSPPGSSVHGILQARRLEWVTCPPPGDLPHPGIEPASLVAPTLQGGSLLLSHQGSPKYCHCYFWVNGTDNLKIFLWFPHFLYVLHWWLNEWICIRDYSDASKISFLKRFLLFQFPNRKVTSMKALKY